MRKAKSLYLTYSTLALALFAAPVAAQPGGLIAELLVDLGQVESKLVGLAEAMPESSYAWRPAEGVRSTAEVFLHVAADNFFLPTVAGTAAPSDTGIKPGDYATVKSYEERKLDKAATIAELKRSFAHLRAAVTATTPARLEDPVEVFGMKSTVRGFWLLATTHVHEHLGQMIAYARSNRVVPPWSR